MESAKRKERPLGLPMETSAASRITTPQMPFSEPAPPLPEQLPNPMFLAAPAAEMSPRTPRFDNYMNPAPAFSGFKRKIEYFSPSSSTPPHFTRPYAGPSSYHLGPNHPPAQQFQITQSPDYVPFPMPPQALQSSPWRSPVQFQTPFSGHHATCSSGPGPWNASTGSPAHGFNPNSSRGGFSVPHLGLGSPMSSGPGPWNASTGSHGFNPNSSRGGFTDPHLGLGSPMSSGPGPCNASTGSPAHGFNPNSSRGGFSVPHLGLGSPMSSGPGPCNASTGSPAHGFNPNSSRGGFRGPHIGQGGPTSNPGIRGSSHSYSGRGKGRQFSSSPNNRGRGGRGQRFKNPSGQEEPEHYYSKTMVEDPWRELKPIVGDILKPLYYSRSWLPKSLAESKSELNQIGVKLDSELSLAESLDISFKETIDGT